MQKKYDKNGVKKSLIVLFSGLRVKKVSKLFNLAIFFVSCTGVHPVFSIYFQSISNLW